MSKSQTYESWIAKYFSAKIQIFFQLQKKTA